MTVCEERFYNVAANSLHALAKAVERLAESEFARNQQLLRIADALESRNIAQGLAVRRHTTDERVPEGTPL